MSLRMEDHPFSQSLRCTECHGLFDNPYTLPCQHRFCRACLRDQKCATCRETYMAAQPVRNIPLGAQVERYKELMQHLSTSGDVAGNEENLVQGICARSGTATVAHAELSGDSTEVTEDHARTELHVAMLERRIRAHKAWFEAHTASGSALIGTLDVRGADTGAVASLHAAQALPQTLPQTPSCCSDVGPPPPQQQQPAHGLGVRGSVGASGSGVCVVAEAAEGGGSGRAAAASLVGSLCEHAAVEPGPDGALRSGRSGLEPSQSGGGEGGGEGGEGGKRGKRGKGGGEENGEGACVGGESGAAAPSHAKRKRARIDAAATGEATSRAAARRSGEGAASGAEVRPAGTVVLLSTGLDPEDVAVMQAVARALGGTVAKKWSPQVTHTISATKCGSNGNGGRLCARTIKYCHAVVQGHWIVGTSWLHACRDASARVPEAPHEIEGDLKTEQGGEGRGGPRLGRQRRDRGEPPLLDGWRISLVGSFSIKRSELQSLLTAAGATLVDGGLDAPPPPRKRDGGAGASKQVVICDEPPPPQRKGSARSIPVVKSEWLLDSISCYELRPCREYAHDSS